MTEEEIHEICEKYKIENYMINPDMTVDVNGSVRLYSKNLTELPLKFNNVYGSFDCSGNPMSSLENCPIYIQSYFALNSLKELSGLRYFPQHIDGNVFIGNSNIPVYEYRWILLSYVGGLIITSYSKLNEFFDNNKNPPKKDLPRLFSELKKFSVE